VDAAVSDRVEVVMGTRRSGNVLGTDCSLCHGIECRCKGIIFNGFSVKWVDTGFLEGTPMVSGVKAFVRARA